MLYELDVRAPANTPATAPVEELVRVTKGVVTQVQVQIPGGHMGLTGAQVWRGASQVWPSNPGGYFKGDRAFLTWAEDYLIEDEPLELRALVWNTDTDNAHTVTFRFAMLGLAEAEERKGLPGLLKSIGQALLGRS